MKKVEVNIQIRTTAENVIKAFTDQKKLSEWWNVEKSLIELRKGGPYVLTWHVTENGFGYVSSGIIEKYNPKEEFTVADFVYMNPDRSLLGPMKLTVKATETNGLTDVYLCQDGYQEGEDWNWYYTIVKQVWPEAMQELKRYLEKN